MKVKLDDYEIRVLINSLYQQRCDYDLQTNNEIDGLLLQLLRKSESMKPCRRRKFRFEPQEISLIRMCLIKWRNHQLLTGKKGAAEAISELVILFTY